MTAPYYNLTNITSQNDIFGIVGAVNNGVGGLFAFMLLVTIGIVFFFSLRTNTTTGNAMRASAFPIAIIAGLMWAAGWISDYFAIAAALIALISLIMSFFSD